MLNEKKFDWRKTFCVCLEINSFCNCLPSFFSFLFFLSFVWDITYFPDFILKLRHRLHLAFVTNITSVTFSFRNVTIQTKPHSGIPSKHKNIDVLYTNIKHMLHTCFKMKFFIRVRIILSLFKCASDNNLFFCGNFSSCKTLFESII